MTKDDIIRMAREVGFVSYGEDAGEYRIPAPAFHSRLEQFAALVRADEREVRSMRWDELIAKAVEAEREACAKVAEQTVCDTHLPTGVRIYGTRAAKAIRARGQDSMPLFDDWGKD